MTWEALREAFLDVARACFPGMSDAGPTAYRYSFLLDTDPVAVAARLRGGAEEA